MNGKDWLKKVERDLEEKIKENDFIYHERIPDEKTLAQVAKAAVAKPTPIPERLGDPSKELLFDALVPVPVHQVVNHLCASETRFFIPVPNFFSPRPVIVDLCKT